MGENGRKVEERKRVSNTEKRNHIRGLKIGVLRHNSIRCIAELVDFAM